jgi:hypothetical protein
MTVLRREPIGQARSKRGLALLLLSFCFAWFCFAAGCGSAPPGAPDAASDGPSTDLVADTRPDAGAERPDVGGDRVDGFDADSEEAGAVDGGETRDGDAGSPGGVFGFLPSNLTIEQLGLSDAATLGDVVVDSAQGCESEPMIRCMISPNEIADVKGYKLLFVRMNGAPTLNVFVARSWTITARTTLPLHGRNVLVALTDIVVEGAIDARRVNELEAGEGSPGDLRVGAGGGSFCGRGGAGAYSSLPRAPTYGTPDLVPPRVGSGGGPQSMSHRYDAGGFLHLLAARSVRVGASGTIGALGGGGDNEGGGSSGGAILIEAPTVEVAGILAANGGGGGALSRIAEAGKLGTARAMGAADPLGNLVGGSGGAGSFVDGDDAMSISVTAGGGGGVGRIRLNSTAARATITGTLSPGLDTVCATQGTLHPLP